MTLGMTIGRSPRGEEPDRPRETHWEGARPPPAAELVGGGSNSTGARQGRRARHGPGSKVGLYTHTETHDPSYNLNVIIAYYCNKPIILNPLIVYSSDYGH